MHCTHKSHGGRLSATRPPCEDDPRDSGHSDSTGRKACVRCSARRPLSSTRVQGLPRQARLLGNWLRLNWQEMQWVEEMQWLKEVGFTDEALNREALKIHAGSRNNALKWLRAVGGVSTSEVATQRAPPINSDCAIPVSPGSPIGFDGTMSSTFEGFEPSCMIHLTDCS